MINPGQEKTYKPGPVKQRDYDRRQKGAGSYPAPLMFNPLILQIQYQAFSPSATFLAKPGSIFSK